MGPGNMACYLPAMFWRSISRILLLLAALLPLAAGAMAAGSVAAGPVAAGPSGPVVPSGDELVRARLVAEDDWLPDAFRGG